MFKEKVNHLIEKEWNIIAVYKYKDKKIFVVQNKLSNVVTRLDEKAMYRLVSGGKNNNFGIKKNKATYAIEGYGKACDLVNNPIELKNRLTPIAVFHKSNEFSRIVEVLLYDEQSNKKLKITIDQFKVLLKNNMVNLVTEVGGRIKYPSEVLHYNIKGTLLKKNTEDKPKVKKLAEGSVEELINKGYEKAVQEGVFDSYSCASDNEDYIDYTDDKVQLSDSVDDIVNSLIYGGIF